MIDICDHVLMPIELGVGWHRATEWGLSYAESVAASEQSDAV